MEQQFARFAESSKACLSSQQQLLVVGDAEQCSCDEFCPHLQQSFLADLSHVPELHGCADVRQFQNLGGHLVVNSGPLAGGTSIEDRTAARKLHKADRERLRRDRLNEQFIELAIALDPDRPKNDKAAILGEGAQAVKELRAEVNRLKAEHASLLNESRDLTEEKNELREEKAALKNETGQLQNQIQQRLQTMSPWMALDPSVMMGAAAFPYPLPVPQPVSLPQSDPHQTTPPYPLVTPAPYIPVPPPLGGFHTHPSLQAYAMFGNRPGDGNSPYMPYPSFPPPVSSHPHIERPYAQYPSPVHPIPGYVVQMQSAQVSQPQMSAAPTGTPIYRPCVPGVPVVPAQNHGSNHRSKGGSHRSHVTQGSSQQEPTDLQLQTNLSAPVSKSQASESAALVTRSEHATPAVREECYSIQDHPEVSSTRPAIASKLCKEDLRSALDRGGLLLDHEVGSKVEEVSQESGDNIDNINGKVHDSSQRPPVA